jgi:hypothetical protein
LGQETQATDRPLEISNLDFSSIRCVFVRNRVGERMVSASVVPTVKHGGDGALLVTV